MTLRPDRARNFEVTRPKIMDFQTKNIIFMRKHRNYIISVPMSSISFLYAYNMTQILYCGGVLAMSGLFPYNIKEKGIYIYIYIYIILKNIKNMSKIYLNYI